MLSLQNHCKRNNKAKTLPNKFDLIFVIPIAQYLPFYKIYNIVVQINNHLLCF